MDASLPSFYSDTRLHIQNKSASPPPARSPTLRCSSTGTDGKSGDSAARRPGPPSGPSRPRTRPARRGRGAGCCCRASPGPLGARALAQSPQSATPAAPHRHLEPRAAPYLHTVIRFRLSTAALRALRLFLPPPPPPAPRLPLSPPRLREAMAGCSPHLFCLLRPCPSPRHLLLLLSLRMRP